MCRPGGGMHEHVCEQLRRIEVGRTEIVQSAERLEVETQFLRKDKHGKPDDKIDDNQIFRHGWNHAEYRAGIHILIGLGHKFTKKRGYNTFYNHFEKKSEDF